MAEQGGGSARPAGLNAMTLEGVFFEFRAGNARFMSRWLASRRDDATLRSLRGKKTQCLEGGRPFVWETYCKDGRSAGDSREWGEVKAVGRRGGWGCIAGVEWRSRERHTGADLWWLYCLSRR